MTSKWGHRSPPNFTTHMAHKPYDVKSAPGERKLRGGGRASTRRDAPVACSSRALFDALKASAQLFMSCEIGPVEKVRVWPL
jgi:hypothetical protein